MFRLTFLVLALVPNIEFVDIAGTNKTNLIVDDCTIEMLRSDVKDTDKVTKMVEELCWNKNSVITSKKDL